MAGLKIPAILSDDTARQEGIAAHHAAMQYISSKQDLTGRRAPNGVFITDEMMEHAAALNKYLDDTVSEPYHIEEQGTFYNLVSYRPDIYGISHALRHVDIVDYKYGYAPVKANNWTMTAYAIGIADHYQLASDFTFSLHIFQPRINHYDKVNLNFAELDFYNRKLIATLNNLTDEVTTGPHCYNCPFMSACPSGRQAALVSVEAVNRAYNDELSNEELANELTILRRAEKAIKERKDAIEELALHRLENGAIIDGFRIEQGYGNTSWNSYVNKEWLKTFTGKELVKESLITPTQAIKNGVSKEIIKAITYRPKTAKKVVEFDINKELKK